MTIVNFSDLAVTCEAPTNHKTMSVADRVCNVLSGFALLDLLKITAELECSRRSLPRGSLVACPRDPPQSPALRSGSSECLLEQATKRIAMAVRPSWGIECFFGRLRSQSGSAQMTARSYWQSSARDMIKTHHDHNGRATEANKEIVPPLDPGRLNAISEKAYKAALQLAALAAGVTMDSLDKKYQEWCSSGRFTTKSDGLGDENMDDDEEDGAPGPDADDEENEGQDFLNQLQAEAALGQEEAEEEQKGQDENPSEVLVMDLTQGA